MDKSPIGRRIEWSIYGCVFRGTVIKQYSDDSPFYAGMLSVLVDKDTKVIQSCVDTAAIFPPGHPEHKGSRYLD